MTSQTTTKGLVCPHCSQAIPMPMVKGLNSIKTCPSCHKGVRYKKPAFKHLLLAFLMYLPIAVVVALILFMLGASPAIIAALNAAGAVIVLVPLVNKHARFDKTE